VQVQRPFCTSTSILGLGDGGGEKGVPVSIVSAAYLEMEAVDCSPVHDCDVGAGLCNVMFKTMEVRVT
jgi:hypothetical protein